MLPPPKKQHIVFHVLTCRTCRARAWQLTRELLQLFRAQMQVLCIRRPAVAALMLACIMLAWGVLVAALGAWLQLSFWITGPVCFIVGWRMPRWFGLLPPRPPNRPR